MVNTGTEVQLSPITLKVSEKEKFANDCEWFKQYLRYTVPALTQIIRDYDKLKRCYDLVNNNIDSFKEEFRRFCDPLGDLDAVAKEENILPFNFIHNKINIFRDGAIKRKPRHYVTSLGNDGIVTKTKEWQKYVKDKILSQMAQMMDISQLPQEQQQAETDKFLAENLPEGFTLNTFRSSWEIFYERVLRWAEQSQGIKNKKIETMDHTVIADRAILYCGYRGNKPVIEVCNPLFTGFHKSPNEPWLEKGDYVYSTESVTAVDILTEYGEKLTEEQKLRLGLYTNAPTIADPRYDVLGGKATAVRNDIDEVMYRENWPGSVTASRYIGAHQTNAGTVRDHYRALLFKTHIEFKAFREVKFLNYIDDYGKTITEVLSEEFSPPKKAKKTKIYKRGEEVKAWEWVENGVAYVMEQLWVPWKYEATRLMGDVFVDCREVPNQYVDIDDPYGSFELSYKGRVFSDMNSESVSLVERAIPYQLQAFYINHIINKELAKYKGVVLPVDLDQIPEELGQDFEGQQINDKVAVFMNYVRHGYAFYSGSQNSFGGLPPATRAQGVDVALMGTAREIMFLMQLLDLVNANISLSMGISPQREAQANSQLTATDNQRDLNASYAITEYFFDQHEEVWAKALNAYLKNFRHYYKQRMLEDPSEMNYLSYIMPDGTIDLFEVTPDSLDMNQIGIYVKTGSSEQEYRNMMMQSVFSIAQNAGEGAEIVSRLIKMISEGESPDTVHREIQKMREDTQRRAEEMQKAQMGSAEKIEQMRIEAREDEQNHQMQMLITKEQMQKEREMETKILDMYQFQEDLNKDQDGIPDALETLKVYNQMKVNDEKIRQGDEKLKLEKEKIEKMSRNKK
jgi:hypothetical protein